MADDFHRPTLTFPTGAYSASQVRLYGKAADQQLIFAHNPKSTNSNGSEVIINVGGSLSNEESIKLKKIVDDFKISEKLSDADIFNLILSGTNFPFPIPKPIGLATQLIIDMKNFGTLVISTSVISPSLSQNNRSLSCGIIVGYSYEGHCYDLPKPKVMIIPDSPRAIPKDDCGFDMKNDPNDPNGDNLYRLWIVDKLDECVEFEMNQGFVEQLVLEANLPGKRSPTAYVGRHMLGHRSGRLTD